MRLGGWGLCWRTPRPRTFCWDRSSSSRRRFSRAISCDGSFPRAISWHRCWPCVAREATFSAWTPPWTSTRCITSAAKFVALLRQLYPTNYGGQLQRYWRVSHVSWRVSYVSRGVSHVESWDHGYLTKEKWATF